MKIVAQFLKLDGYIRRGIIFIVVSLFGISYELLFVHPLRAKVILLWLGVIVIGVLVMLTLRDPES